MQLDLRTGVERLFQIRLLSGLQAGDGPLEQLHVEVVADLLDLAALLIAQQFAGAADLQIVGGERESRAELFQAIPALRAA